MMSFCAPLFWSAIAIGAWLDDGQVVKMMLVKLYATEDDSPGCTIRIESTAP